MQKIAKFLKVDFEQFKKDWIDTFGEVSNLEEIYEEIVLPKRGTKGSAGYDFCSPSDFELKPGETVKVPTGIRSRITDGWVLMCFPRSSMGFKYRMQLDNTVGIIDADYFEADNQGHIMIKVTNDSKSDKILKLEKGKGFAQGIFVPFGITEDDDAQEVRTGGFGSTDNKTQ